MVKHFFIIQMLLTPIWVMAQSGAVTAGGNITGAGGNVSFSVGQIVTNPVSGTTGKITQGIQQPYEIFVVTGINQNSIQLKAVVYPNPASGFVVLSVEQKNINGMTCVLTDMQGKVISSQEVKSPQTRIDLSQLAQGAYQLQVFQNNESVKIFKVIKK